ncbi:MAG: M48 family metalloprotease [Clostridia bacterium]|nr:M48 family metalloprotease [Clostridia bacterium]
MKDFMLDLLRTFSLKYFTRFKVLIQKPRLILFLAINFLIIWGFYWFHPFMVIPALIYTSVFFLIALSDWLEWLLRRLGDVRHVATNTEKERLNDLFDGVLSDTSIKQDVAPYIIDSASINAQAIGRTSVILSRGALEHFSDKQLKGTIAHELGHIENGDTVISNIITVYTFVYFFLVYIARFILMFIQSLFATNFIGDIFKFLITLLDLFFRIVSFVCNVIICGGSRTREYKADKYAYNIGYGAELTSTLYAIYDMEISDKKGLIEQMQASHPKVAYRIEKIEQLTRQ